MVEKEKRPVKPLLDMWLESSSVNVVNLVKKICYNSGDIEFLLGDCFFGAHCISGLDIGPEELKEKQKSDTTLKKYWDLVSKPESKGKPQYCREEGHTVS